MPRKTRATRRPRAADKDAAPLARGAAAACRQAPWVAGTRPAHRCGITTQRPAVTTGERPLTASRVFCSPNFSTVARGKHKRPAAQLSDPASRSWAPAGSLGQGSRGRSFPGGPRALGTPAAPAQGTHHGIVVAVHHQRPSSSQVDVLLPPVAHLRGANTTDPWQLSGSPKGRRGPGGATRALWHKCVCVTHATARGGAEAPVQPAPDVNRRHLLAPQPRPLPAPPSIWVRLATLNASSSTSYRASPATHGEPSWCAAPTRVCTRTRVRQDRGRVCILT